MNGVLPARTVFGVVAIGRNEGDRLRRCLQSAKEKTSFVVYVDSGSTDDSVPMARAMGCDVVELEMKLPFTAARARNEGFQRAMQMAPDLAYVQFVDGDCEFDSAWFGKAVRFLDAHPEVAVVCGRRRERHPEKSVYNMLCDIEWDSPVGETRACGGDAMMRINAFAAVKGFRTDLIAGEEPELCVRLRAADWRIWRLGEEMTLHDAAMTRFSQWWKRSKRAGHAFAEGSWLHGAPPERHYVRHANRALLWGIVLPVAVTVATLLNPLSAGLALIYPIQVLRISAKGGIPGKNGWLRAFFLVLGRFPEGLGLLSFHINRILGTRKKLIEYK